MKEYKKFSTADFKINLFALFFEQAIKLGRIKSCQSFIIPDTSLNLSAFTKLRKYILHQGSLIHISYFKNNIFENVSVGKSVIITTIKNIKNDSFHYRIFDDRTFYNETVIKHSSILKDEMNRFIEISNTEERVLLSKIRKDRNTLDAFCDIYDGINPGSEELKNLFFSNEFKDEYSKKVIDGKNFEKYSTINWDNLYVYYCKDFADEIKEQFRKSNKQFTARIIKRTDFFNSIKIVTRQTADSIIGTLDNKNYYTKNSVHSTLIKSQFQFSLDIKYVLALLNSKLINWVYQYEANEAGRLFPQVKIDRLRKLPFEYSHIQQPIITFLNQILEAKQANPQADTSALEAQIDQLVYELYGLTQEEIDIIEGNN